MSLAASAKERVKNGPGAIAITRMPCSARVERVALPWYACGIARVRVSTTVDGVLLNRAREARSGVADSALLDEALTALLASRRAAEIDAAYAAYEDHPLDEADGWGDLASFRAAAGAS